MRSMHARAATVFILGLGLALAGFAGPVGRASAEKKGKKAEAAEPKSLDEMMDDSATSKKKAKSDDQAASEDGDAEKPEEEVAEPEAWEKPPEEEEKAPEPEPKAPPPPPDGDGNSLEAGLLLGWGFQTNNGAFGTDPYGLGFGVRGGYEFDFKLYVGVGFQYYLGSTDTLQQTTGQTVGTATESTSNYMFVEAEVGYDLWFGDVILRPSLWIGAAIGTQNPHPLTLGKKTVTDFFFGPGAGVIYVMDGIFFGGDLRLHQVTNDDGASALSLYAYGGLRF